MQIKGHVIDVKNNHIVFRSDEDITLQDFKKHVTPDGIKAIMEVYEKDSITDLQRNHFFALIKDYEFYTGEPFKFAEVYFKFRFMKEYDLDDLPSVARNQMTKSRASDLLEFVITFFIQNDIPFQKQQFYLTTDVSKMNFALTMKRLCVACGKPHADIHHATKLVGMGRDRKVHEHWRSTFMSLCRPHHNEVHSIGLEEFMKKYYVKPIRLSIDNLREIGLITEKQRESAKNE